MTVIRFPGAAASPQPAPKKIDTLHKMLMGTVTFTCSNCATPSEITTSGMIFRTIEFYCHCCGTYFKVTNPAFAAPTRRRA